MSFYTDSQTWDTSQVPFFAQSYTVITPYLRGYPPSGVPPLAEDYVREKLVFDLLAILDNEGSEAAMIIGHDVSGGVAQYFSTTYPERVNSLILINTVVLSAFEYLIEFDKAQEALLEYTIAYEAYEPGQPKNISCIIRNIYNATYRAEIANYLEIYQ